ncbi:MAG TPA: hypothetical protein VKA53_00640 [Thermoanaerobaculia bacterium]|nr:hypothetical protein [Thermoanaerobaculia bacterium]
MKRRGGWSGYAKFLARTLLLTAGLLAIAVLFAPKGARDQVTLPAIVGGVISLLASWVGGLPLALAATLKRNGTGEAGNALTLVLASTVLRLVAVAAVTGAILWRTDLSPGALLLAVAGIYLALLPLDVKWALDA